MTTTEAKKDLLSYGLFLASYGLFLATLVSVQIISEDVDIYYSNVESPACCGWVESNMLKRPFTYLMVDEWTEPKWTVNAVRTEEWLVSDGLVNGEVEFWTVLDKRNVSKTSK
jgi:hypothetical protein